MIEVLAEDADRINMVIIGLLVVAALLAVLTLWYWRHTDPKRRVAADTPRPAAVGDVDAWLSGDQPAAAGHAQDRAPVAGAATQLGSMAAPTESDMRAAFGKQEQHDPQPKQSISDDEWMRLTGPRSNDG